jgi:cyanophycinase
MEVNMEEKAKGNLVIIGGAEDKQRDCVILREVVKLAGGNNAEIIVMTAATEYPKEVGNEYIHIFQELGVRNINAVDIASRNDANNRYSVELIEKASCIFFTGGDQLRITSLLGGTQVERAMLEGFRRGIVIAGTSAGASVMSETMIISGKDDETPKKCTLKMAPGLGLLKEVVIDQHFAQRGRIGRLLTAIAQNPHMLGVGIDEDTAIHVTPDAVLKVIGSHAVTILDAVSSSHTNVSELQPDEILAFTNVTLHVLPAGYGYNLYLRKPIENVSRNQEEIQ